MPNDTLRADARALPETTNRRAVMGAVLAAGAAAVLPAVASAASPTPPLSALDRRVLDLWRRRTRMRAALDQIRNQMDAAEAQMPEWARSGPKYMLTKAKAPELSDILSEGDTGWPQVADLDQQHVDALGRIFARPSVFDFINQFGKDRAAIGLDEARRKLTRALVAHDERIKEQRAEQERTGYNRLSARLDAGWDKVVHVESEIKKHAGASILALAATFLIYIQSDDEEEDVLRASRASIAAIRPQLVGAIAEDADRLLVQDEKVRT
jgi:hypothetical protein